MRMAEGMRGGGNRMKRPMDPMDEERKKRGQEIAGGMPAPETAKTGGGLRTAPEGGITGRQERRNQYLESMGREARFNKNGKSIGPNKVRPSNPAPQQTPGMELPETMRDPVTGMPVRNPGFKPLVDTIEGSFGDLANQAIGQGIAAPRTATSPSSVRMDEFANGPMTNLPIRTTPYMGPSRERFNEMSAPLPMQRPNYFRPDQRLQQLQFANALGTYPQGMYGFRR